MVNAQSDGESETEEEGGKGETKELTLLQIMERRYIYKCQKNDKKWRRKKLSKISRVSCFCSSRQASTTVIDILRDEEDFRVIMFSILYTCFHTSIFPGQSCFLFWHIIFMIFFKKIFCSPIWIKSSSTGDMQNVNVSGSKRFTAV